MEHNTLDMWIAISQAALANDVVNTQRAVSLWKPLIYAFAAFSFSSSVLSSQSPSRGSSSVTGQAAGSGQPH
jgi:hypothetical protein